jgi:nucleoside-diphosphate-sugar epimerase
MTRALITGATGLLGRHLVPALVARFEGPHRALVLPHEDAGWLHDLDVEVVRGELRDCAALRTAVEQMELVYNLAALTGPNHPDEDYFAVNTHGAVNVCRAALAAGVRRIIHASSWTVYGSGRHGWVDERTPLAPIAEPYAFSKAGGDLAVQRLIGEVNLPAVIIRPATFFGPGDHRHFGRLATRMRAGRRVLVGSGQNALPWVYVDDVVRGFLLASVRECAVGRAYNIATDDPLTQEACLNVLAAELDLPSPLHHRWHATDSRMEPYPTRLGLRVFGEDNRHSIARASAELGYIPDVPVREGIRRTAAWYRTETPPSVPARIALRTPNFVAGVPARSGATTNLDVVASVAEQAHPPGAMASAGAAPHSTAP